MNHSFIFFLVICFSSLHSQSMSGLNYTYLSAYGLTLENSINRREFPNPSWKERTVSPNGHLCNTDRINDPSTSLNCYIDRSKKKYSDTQECNTPVCQPIPFLFNDKEWIVYYQGFTSMLDDGIRTYRFSEAKDTVDGVPLYELVYSTPANPNLINTQQFYKEENGKVSRYYENGDEDLIYNFSVQVGDTIVRYPEQPLFNLLVVKIDTVFFNDLKPRRRFHLLCQVENNRIFYWIEGMGGDDSFLNSSICTIFDGPTLTLRCFFDNGVKVYQDPLIQDCLISSVEDNHNLKVKISPIPSSSMMYIDNLISPASVLIYNMAGVEILRLEHVQNQIDIGELNQGLYILEVRQGKNIERHRIVKIN